VKKLQETWEKLKKFVLEAYAEFKKVSWPSKEKTIRLTAYVIGVSLGVAVLVWGIDLLLKEGLSKIILK